MSTDPIRDALGTLLGELKVVEEVPRADDLDEVMEMAITKIEALKAWRARARELRRQRDKERAKKEALYERLTAVRVDLATVLEVVITKTGSPVYDNAVERLQDEASQRPESGGSEREVQ